MWLAAMIRTTSFGFSPLRRKAVDKRSTFVNNSLYFIDLPVVKSVCKVKDFLQNELTLWKSLVLTIHVESPSSLKLFCKICLTWWPTENVVGSDWTWGTSASSSLSMMGIVTRLKFHIQLTITALGLLVLSRLIIIVWLWTCVIYLGYIAFVYCFFFISIRWTGQEPDTEEKWQHI